MNDEIVIEKYGDMVYRLAYARTGNRHDADDIFQEVFIRYVKKERIFREEEHRKAWLIKVTIHCCNDFFKAIFRKKTEELKGEFIFEERELQDLQKELQKIPKKYREVIHLFYYEDMSIEEISLALKRKNSTVRTQLTRARNLLRTFMKEEDYEF